MKNFYKDNKLKIIIAILLTVIVVAGITIYLYFSNQNALTIEERNWIDSNVNSNINVNIVNNANIFGNNGEGVYYDFLNDFSLNYNLQINPITFNYEVGAEGLTLGVKNAVSDNDIVLYEDNYVLIGKTNETINVYADIEAKQVGVLSSDKSFIENNLAVSVEFTEYETEEELIKSLSEELNYIIVPKNLYLDQILSLDYKVLFHFSDLNYYFTLSTDDTILSDILVKYYENVWNLNFYESYKTNEFNVFVENLAITESQVDSIRSIVYNYGFITNSPYEVIEGGDFGGISAVMLKEFSDFAGVDFEFNKYKNYNEFVNAIENKNIDVYLDKYNFTAEASNTFSGLNLDYTVAVNRKNDLVINSLNSLIGETVYVEKNSILYDYITKVNGLDIKTYSTESDLLDLNKKDVIIILDYNTFEYFSRNELGNYTERYFGSVNQDIVYGVTDDEVLAILLDKFVNITDDEKITNRGIENHYETVKTGNLLSILARYIITIALVILVVLYFIVKGTKKIKIAKKIKRDDKMKFIDQLTSLKNRNYLNECLEAWNNNTIYPQAIVTVNLNAIQAINDLHGYNEGDRQIKSFANALIKTQLDNSEVMRTDGNEFIMYLIGYSQKQITNYIHKLNKEVDKLPYDNGAKFGYSMILDDIKTVEDCMNEAAQDMKVKSKNEKI